MITHITVSIVAPSFIGGALLRSGRPERYKRINIHNDCPGRGIKSKFIHIRKS